MITARIRTFDFFPELTAEIEARTIEALNAAAEAGRAVADQQAAGMTTFSVVPAHRTVDGFASGINAKNRKFWIFDKGSLGKRHAPLKRNRRKDSWEVNRKGTTYEAHRRDVTGKGIAPKDISNPARRAGRKALISGIRGR